MKTRDDMIHGNGIGRYPIMSPSINYFEYNYPGTMQYSRDVIGLNIINFLKYT